MSTTKSAANGANGAGTTTTLASWSKALLVSGAVLLFWSTKACQPTGGPPSTGTYPARRSGDAGAVAEGGAIVHPSLAQVGQPLAPGFVLVREERHVSPSTWTWELPKDGCFRVFARADVPATMTMDEFTAELGPTHAGSNLRLLPADGPRCGTRGTKWAFGLTAATQVNVELAIFGSP